MIQKTIRSRIIITIITTIIIAIIIVTIIPTIIPTIISAAPDNKKPLPAKGAVYTVGKAVYQVNVSDETNGTVTFVKPFKKTYTSVTVPATVDIEGYTFRDNSN